MPIPFWDTVTTAYEGLDYAESPWDIVYLNGERTPGIATVKCSPRIVIDVKKPSGGDGASTTERGHAPAKISIAIKVWTPRQWELLQALIDTFWRRPGKDGKQDRPGQAGKAIKATGAIDIKHPACALFGVTSIVLESPESPEPAPEQGAMVVRFSAIQYIPKSPPASRKTTGSGRPVPIAPELQRAKNVAGLPPSKTAAKLKLPPTPASGSS